MITFSLCLLLLIGGYFVYGKFIENIFRPDDRTTPAYQNKDGVDFIPLPTWKVFTIQFLNIAGIGPIFGAIMGAQFGTSCYLWIVLGCIFGGAVHDYLSGMMSVRKNGATLSELIGEELGEKCKNLFNVFVIILLFFVVAIFISAPATLLDSMTPHVSFTGWMGIILTYYIMATLLPIDKIIGQVYPIFALALMFMVIGILVMLFVQHPVLPEMWEGFGKRYDSSPLFPMMFISIACGAVSGFHATQSPLMARCIKNEREGRRVFYGAMIAEGIVTLTWAAVAVHFFSEYGTTHFDANGKEVVSSGAYIADFISRSWLGKLGGVLAILGIVAAPISTGDTAMRAARLTLSSTFHISQKRVLLRLFTTLLCIVPVVGILVWSLESANSFKVVWQHFAWSNQVLSVFTLWAITIYLKKKKKPFIVSLIPALFMTMVCTTYVSILYLPHLIGVGVAGGVTLISLLYFVKH